MKKVKRNIVLITAIALVVNTMAIFTSCSSKAQRLPKAKRIFSNSNILVEDYCDGSLPLNFDGDTFLFSVYKDGKLKDSVRAKKLIKDIELFRKEKQLGDICFVGYILSVFEDGLILDMGQELMWYDFNSKEFLSSSERETSAKIDKLCLEELDDLLSATLHLIQDERDRGMLLSIQDSIHSESHENLKYEYTHAYSKLAHENLIKASYFYKTDSTHINLFILDEDSSLLVDIYGGGDKKAMEEKGLTTYDFDPSRYYRFYPKTGELTSGDFYWE